MGVCISLVAIVPWWELWKLAAEDECPPLWSLTIARLWKAVAPVARAGLLLDLILLALLGLL